MHFLLAWTHVGAEKTDAAVEACLADLPREEPFARCRVVRVPGFAVYETVCERLNGIDAPGFRFIMSPIARTGRYYGRLPEAVARGVDALSDANP